MSILSKMIEKHKENSYRYGRQEYLQSLAGIGKNLDESVPNDISQKDLLALENELGQLKKLIKSEKAKESQIILVNELIAKVSRLANKKPSQRTEKMNLDLLNLGGQLMNLQKVLQLAPLSIIAKSVFNHFIIN